MKPVLVACERTGIVRDFLRALGVEAYSCDLAPNDSPYHIQEDAVAVLAAEDWGGLIAFPPCTHLASAGARWFKDKQDGQQQEAVNFFLKFALAPVPFRAVENPIGIMSRLYRKPDQVIQPYNFGHPESKATCLWLEGLPPLKATQPLGRGSNRIHWYPDSKGRADARSATYPGIARAMAQQWAPYFLQQA